MAYTWYCVVLTNVNIEWLCLQYLKMVKTSYFFSVGEGGVEYGSGERDLAQEMHPQEGLTSPPPLALQTPPRVLTLQDRNLDSLDVRSQIYCFCVPVHATGIAEK